MKNKRYEGWHKNLDNLIKVTLSAPSLWFSNRMDNGTLRILYSDGTVEVLWPNGNWTKSSYSRKGEYKKALLHLSEDHEFVSFC